MKTVAIVDYGMCNLFSVHHACCSVGLNAIITSDKKQLLCAGAMILPGVGAFGEAMVNLRILDLIEPIKDFIASGRKFMGICLGMQLLLSESEEFGRHKGLNVIEGTVKKFQGHTDIRIKVPQIGWNQIFPASEDSWTASPLRGLKSGEFMYFIHSYYVEPSDIKVVLSHTKYHSTEYCSSLLRNNVFAAQYHPEKSGMKGLNIYRNWALSIKKQNGENL
ncbi:MAG: imidazole glycerol phosphate synthase subunit HisH [Deltaproteobacteria bacterium]|nr:imidazole glycerol phosphate synthase subunit HisH [Deltaproteobacteria bacterium]